jgi:hypothetical protein
MANLTPVEFAYRTPALEPLASATEEDPEPIECDLCSEAATRLVAFDDDRAIDAWRAARLIVCDVCFLTVLRSLSEKIDTSDA